MNSYGSEQLINGSEERHTRTVDQEWAELQQSSVAWHKNLYKTLKTGFY